MITTMAYSWGLVPLMLSLVPSSHAVRSGGIDLVDDASSNSSLLSVHAALDLESIDMLSEFHQLEAAASRRKANGARASTAVGDADGLCHCMTQKDYKEVDWDDEGKFHDEEECLKKCPKRCVEADKDIRNYPFFECEADDGRYECNCVDFGGTAHRMDLDHRDKVYHHVFVRWNFRDEDQGDTIYYERMGNIQECKNDCRGLCHKAERAIDEHGNPYSPEDLKGVCTVSNFDWEGDQETTTATPEGSGADRKSVV